MLYRHRFGKHPVLGGIPPSLMSTSLGFELSSGPVAASFPGIPGAFRVAGFVEHVKKPVIW